MASRKHSPAAALGRSDQLASGELRRCLDDSHRLLDTACALASQLDLAETRRVIVQQFRAVLRCDYVSLCVPGKEGGTWTTSAACAEGVDASDGDLDQAIAEYVGGHRVCVEVADPTQDDRFCRALDAARQAKTGHILAAPLIGPGGGALLGVLQCRQQTPLDDCRRQLFRSCCHHATLALDRVRQVDMLRRRHSVQASLDVAREIQRGFMPSRLPAIPGYEVATWWLANEAVGGDYCDVIPLKDQRVALVIADVSGHGLGPSLIMAEVRAALHALVLEHTEPEVLLNLLDRSLSPDLGPERFITLALGVLDPFDHNIQYANAGHGPALHFEAATGEFIPLESTGMPLGVGEHPGYQQGWPLMLETGDLVVFCTDGVVEALDHDDRPFGRPRLEAIIRKAASLPVEQIVARLGQQVQEHYGGGSPPDDVTVLTLRRNR